MTEQFRTIDMDKLYDDMNRIDENLGLLKNQLKINDLDELLDNERGMGCMGVNRDADYFGFSIRVSLNTFINLVPKRRADLEAVDIIYNRIIDGEKIASPTLFVTWSKRYKVWLINGHEGRGRVIALNKLYDDNFINRKVPRKITTHIITERLRSHDLTPEMLNAYFVSQMDYQNYDNEKDEFDIKPAYYYDIRK